MKGSLAVLVVLLTACSATPAPSPTQTWISVAGDAKTGASGFITVTGSGFHVDWTLTAPPGGCDFLLRLTKPENAQGGVSLLISPTHLSAGKQTGGVDWEDVGPGTFILREDRKGPASCKVPWSGRVTQR